MHPFWVSICTHGRAEHGTTHLKNKTQNPPTFNKNITRWCRTCAFQKIVTFGFQHGFCWMQIFDSIHGFIFSGACFLLKGKKNKNTIEKKTWKCESHRKQVNTRLVRNDNKHLVGENFSILRKVVRAKAVLEPLVSPSCFVSILVFLPVGIQS